MALNVLVVDDSSVVRTMIVKTLHLAGFPIGEIYQAGDGQEGLDILEAHWVDLALVDINMPVMNGEEMIERVRANPEWQDLPIIVVSTEGSQKRIGRLQEKGAKFVHKPFAPEVVREMVEEITGITHEQQV